MKIIITNKYKSWDNAKTGKGFFAQRLINQLKVMGHTVYVDPNAEADIALGIGKFEFNYPKCKKKILRLGDAHKGRDYKKANKFKRISLNMADGIIYQSQYSKGL